MLLPFHVLTKSMDLLHVSDITISPIFVILYAKSLKLEISVLLIFVGHNVGVINFSSDPLSKSF